MIDGAPEEALGTLDDVQDWGDILFGGDKCQKKAFEVIVVHFVIVVYEKAENDDISRRKRKIDNEIDKLRKYIC